MALAKDHHQTPSRSFYEFPNISSVQFPNISPYGFDNYDQQDGDGLESPNSNKVMISPNNRVVSTNSQANSTSSSSANSSSNGIKIHHYDSNYQPLEEAKSSINFKSEVGSFMNSTEGSLLSFQNEDQLPYHKQSYPINHHYPIWEGNCSISSINHHHLKEMKSSTSSMNLVDEVNHLRTSISDYNRDSSTNDEWIYAEANINDLPQESTTQQTCFNKRPNMDEQNVQAPKKHCKASASKKPTKAKSTSTFKDPQSLAAKNRRERISERLKILQDLVPNGSKVDLVTMLEKAIGYVKFLQLQVKVLATDEFWPAAGGKAPDISQVREAIDAILLSQRSS